MRSCRTRGCRESVGRGKFYCYDHWRQLFDKLCGQIEEIIEGASTFYIGRTYNPQKRRRQHARRHGREHIQALHWSRDIEEICAIEEALIRKFDVRGNKNRSEKADGDAYVDLRNCIYVSWSGKSQSSGRRW